MLTQRGGGWPLTMFLSPRDQRPYFGGTYFPPEPKYGMPAFRDLLARVAQYYREHGEDVRRQGDALVEVFGQTLPAPVAAQAPLSRGPLATGRAALQRDFDGRFGGFGDAPKFPHPINLEFLLRTWRATADDDQPDLQALYMATLTLTRMAEGGLYDQLGGGFCRYSVDPYWMIPHFEKLRYDNGQLLAVCAQAAVATGDPLFRRVAGETADWIRRDMESPAGAWYATLDADSEGHEGKFYAFITGLLKGRKSRFGLLAVVLAAAGLSIAWLGPEHYRLGGAFLSDPGSGGGTYWSAFQAPLDSAGKTAALRVNVLTYGPSGVGLLAAFDADTITELVGQLAMVKNDTAKGTIAGYLLKQGVPPELKAIWIFEGVIKFTGPNSNEAIGINKLFLPSADANGDGLPDPGTTPVVESPMHDTVNRMVELFDELVLHGHFAEFLTVGAYKYLD